jgi:acetyl esterase
MTDPGRPPVPLLGRAELGVARALARLPLRARRWLSGEPPVVLDGQTLDPDVQLVRALRRRRARHGLCEPTPAAARARYRREARTFAGEPTAVGAVRDIMVNGADGALRARHYAPPHADGARAPLLVYLHGGGFVIGDLDTHDEPCRRLCRQAETHVLAVDYRLAPEHPFPAALDDARAALRWARAHAAALGADPARVAIGGDSAGANLAAVAARLAAREGAPPRAQLLIYPTTDGPTERPSRALFGDGWFLDRADRAAFARHYTHGTGVGEEDPRISPLRAPDLGALPPALVVTAGFDILRDEGEAYAAALASAGTMVRAYREPTLPHGFLHMTALVPAAQAAVVRLAREWRELLALSPAEDA